MDSFIYKTLGRNAVLKLGAVAIVAANGVHLYYALPQGDPWPSKVASLVLSLLPMLGLTGSVAPTSVKPDLPQGQA